MRHKLPVKPTVRPAQPQMVAVAGQLSPASYDACTSCTDFDHYHYGSSPLQLAPERNTARMPTAYSPASSPIQRRPARDALPGRHGAQPAYRNVAFTGLGSGGAQDVQQVEAPTQLMEDTGAQCSATGLPHNLQSGMEHLSGIALDQVKVHYNSPKPAAVNALAYTQGSDIHVAPRQEQHLPHEAWHVVQQAQGRVKPTLQMAGGVQVNDDPGLEKEADLMGEKALNTSMAINSPQAASFAPQNKFAMQMKQISDVANSRQVIQAKFKIGDYEDNHAPTDKVDDADLDKLYFVLGLQHDKSVPYEGNLKKALAKLIENYRKANAKKDVEITTGDALDSLKSVLKDINETEYDTGPVSKGTFPKNYLAPYFVMYGKHAQNVQYDPHHQTFLPPVGIGGGMNTPLNLTQTDGSYLRFSELEKSLFGLSKVTKSATGGIEIESAQVSDSTTGDKMMMVSGNDEQTNAKIRSFFGNAGDTARDSRDVWNDSVRKEMISRRKNMHMKLLSKTGTNKQSERKKQAERKKLFSALNSLEVVSGIKFSKMKYNPAIKTFYAGTTPFAKDELFKIIVKSFKKIHQQSMTDDISQGKGGKMRTNDINALRMERAMARSIRRLLKQDDREIAVIFNNEGYHAESAIRRNVKSKGGLSIDKVGGTKVPCTECHTGYSLDGRKSSLILDGMLMGGMYSTDKTLAQNSDLNSGNLATQQLILNSLATHYHPSKPKFLGGVGDLSLSQVYELNEGDADVSDVSDDEGMNEEIFEDDVNEFMNLMMKKR